MTPDESRALKDEYCTWKYERRRDEWMARGEEVRQATRSLIATFAAYDTYAEREDRLLDRRGEPRDAPY